MEMARLVYRCKETDRIISTGIDIDPKHFERFPPRTVSCPFCGAKHTWQIVDQDPDWVVPMSLKAETYLGLSVEAETLAANATDCIARQSYARIAEIWYHLATQYEAAARRLAPR